MQNKLTNFTFLVYINYNNKLYYENLLTSNTKVKNYVEYCLCLKTSNFSFVL